MLASSAALADTAASSASSPAVQVAPAAPPKKAKRQGKRPKLGKAKVDSAGWVIVGDTQVSYKTHAGCFGPYQASRGWYRTCVWDGFTFGGAFLQREYHDQYFDGATYRPGSTVACDSWTCWRI